MLNKIKTFPDLSEIISLLPGNVYWKNREGVYLGCNQNAADFIDLKSPAELVGKTLYDIYPKDIADETHFVDEKVMQSGEPTSTEEKAYDTDGNLIIYLSHKVPLRDSTGEVIGLLGVSIDITQRKHYEKTLTQAQQNDEYPDLEEIISVLPGNIYWKNRKGIYLGCNNNMARLVKLNHRQDYLGKTLYDFAPKDIADNVTQTDESIMQSGQELCVEEEAFDPEGNPATYFTRKVPLKNNTGKVIGLAGISIDITERKRYEEALKIAKEKAEVANKAKSNFIMNMSHDIRTPFSGILGLSQFLFEKEKDSEKKEILNCIVESTENLLDILNEVIYLATIDKKSPGEIKAFNLRTLLENIYKTMQPETMHKNLSFKLKIKSKIPIHLKGDEFALKRILLNLVGNAVKFTDSGSVVILVEAMHKTDTEVKLKFMIQDTGIGIPEDKQETIFEQFSKLSPSYEGKQQGTGLGLWFVKKITEDMGGEITVESKLGKGSSFSCTLSFILDFQED